MKIHICSEGRDMKIVLPTNLVFSSFVANLGNTLGRKYAGDAMKDISSDELGRLFRELRRIKRKYGAWELVEVNSADGERVQIIL